MKKILLLLVLLSAAAFAQDTQIASDTLDRENCVSSCGSGGKLGANWTQSAANSLNHFKIASAYYGVNATGSTLLPDYRSVAYYSAAAFNNDQYAQGFASTANSSVGIGVRIGSTLTSNATVNGYFAVIQTDDSEFGEYSVRLFKVVNGTKTQLGSPFSSSSLGTLYLSAIGSSITVKYDGVTRIIVTDAALTTGTPGVYSGVNGDFVKTWSAGNSGGSAPVADPSISPATATYANDQSVTITTITSGATICYTTDGSTPAASTPGTCSAGTTYSGAFTVSATGTAVKAIGTKVGSLNSAVVTNTYTLAATASASPTGGTFNNDQSVTLSTTTTGATVRYTTDGGTPTCSSTQYSTPLSVTSTTTIKSIACKENYGNSVRTDTYTLQAATPTDTPGAGSYATAQSVSLSTGTTSATICYTVDGSTPTASAGACTGSSQTYSSAFNVGQTTTVKAIAAKNGYTSSSQLTSTYTILIAATPTISFPTGTYVGRIYPKFTCSTPGSSIYYTTDGSTPTTSSALFVNVTPPTGVTAVKSGTGGTLLDQEFNYRVTAITATGETLISAGGTAANLTGTGTNSVTVSWNAVPGSTGYKIYGRSATDNSKGLLATVGAVTSWVDTGANTPDNKAWLIYNRAGFPVYDTTGVPTATSGTQTFKAICTKAAYGDSAVATSVFTINPSDVQLVYDDFNSYDTTVFQSGSYQIGLPLDQWWTNGKWTHISPKTGSVSALQFQVITVLTREMCNREGNQCVGTGNAGDGFDMAAANIEASYSADQWASIKVWDSEHHDGGVCLRCNTDGDTDETGYKITAYATQIGQEEELGGRVTVSKFVDGVETVLCKNDDLYTSFGHAQYWGATLKGRIAGNTLEATINGEHIPGCPAVFIDSSPITQGNPGFWSYGAYNSASMLTEFRAGNVGSTPVANSTPLIPNWSYQTYSSASVGASWPWVPAAVQQELHYREPFDPNGQFEKVTVSLNTSDPELDRWAVELKQESWMPGSRDGGCTAAGTPCTNSTGYYIGARPYNKSIADNGVVSACFATNGEYACKPFAHIAKTTHAVGSTTPGNANYCGGTYNPEVNLTGCNNIITLASSAITPMQGDEWYGEYVDGRVRAACKRSQTYGSWQGTHAYSLNAMIVDGNGNFQRVVAAGTSAGSAPTFATSWNVTQGNRVTDGGVTWEYYGKPCPSTTEFTWVMEATDNDLVDRVSYPALSAFGPAVSSTFTDWSAGSATTSTACSLLELCTEEVILPVGWMSFYNGVWSGTPTESCLVDTTGMTAINGPTNITVSGNYFLQDNLSCEGTCISVNANDVHLYLQGKTLTYGTNPATFTTVDSDGAVITVGSPSEQALPRPGTTLTDGSFATVTDISNTITCSDATTKTRGVNYRLGVDSYTGDPRGFIWTSGKPAVGVTCTVPSYTYTYPRFGIYNSTWDTYTRATGNSTGGGNGMTVSCGTIQPSINAPAFNMPIWVSNKTTPTISDMVLYGRGWSAPAMGLSYVAGATVQNNTVSCDSATSGVFNRNQYEGYCIWNKNNSTALSGQKSIFANNTVLDSVQGGITQDQDNSEIYGNTITTRSRYTNDFAINAQRTGTKVYNNTINNYSVTDDEVSGRGVRAATNGEIYNNVIKVHGAPNNYEYGGCQAGDVYGIQAEGVTGTSIHDNQIFAYARTCDARGLRITSTGGITVTNNTIKALRHDASASGVAIGISAREAIGTVVGSNTIESDTWIIEDESQTTASNPSNITYRGTTFKKGPNPAAGFHTWSPQNYAQLAATSATHTCIDCVVQNSASLSDVTAHVLNSSGGYWKQYDIWVKWTYTVNVKVGSVPVQGATVTMTDATSTMHIGTTNALGNAVLELPQYRFYNTTGAAVVTENHNAYSLAITKAGCTTVNASGINVTGTTTDNRTTTCP
jgi:hypothetical protein